MIEDNFLKQETFDKLQLLMVNPQVDKAYFPWYFRCGYYDLNEGEKDYNENAKRVTKAMKELNLDMEITDLDDNQLDFLILYLDAVKDDLSSVVSGSNR